MQPAADADLFFSTPALKETILLFLSVTIQRRKDSLGEGQSSPGTLRRRCLLQPSIHSLYREAAISVAE